jgi:hypothetical protein
MTNIKRSLDTTWFYTGDLRDRPAAAKIEVVPVGVWEFGWEVSFYRPRDAEPFRTKLYLDPPHAYAVAKRYVRFATCTHTTVTIEQDDCLTCIANILADIKSEAVVSTVSREDIMSALLNGSEDFDVVLAARSGCLDQCVDHITDKQLQQIAQRMGDILHDAYWEALDETIRRVMGREWLDAALHGGKRLRH